MAEQPSTSTPTPVTESNGQVNGNASTTKKGPSPEDIASAQSLKDQGNAAFKSSDYPTAISYYLQAVDLDPQPSYYSNLAAAQMGKKSFKDAVGSCIRSLEIYERIRHEKEEESGGKKTDDGNGNGNGAAATLTPKELDIAVSKVLIRLGKCHLALGDLAGCESTLSRLPSSETSIPGSEQLKASLKRANQHLDSAHSNLKSSNYRMAHIALDKAISEVDSASGITSSTTSSSSTSSSSTVPISWRILRCLIYLSQGKIEDSSSSISDALRLNPQDPDALTLRGQVLLVKGDVTKSLAHAQAALRSDPEHKDSRELLKRCRKLERAKEEGNDAFKSGDNEGAVEKYSNALSLCDSTSLTLTSLSIPSPALTGFKAILFSNRATAHSKLGNHSSSIADCTSALELDSGYLKALRIRARSNLADEKFEDAVKDFKNAVEESGGDDALKRELKNAELELKKSKKKDYYKILGIPKDASSAEIKKAFRSQSLIHHPDKGGDEEKFKLVNEAFGILSDDDKRRRFDAGQDDLESDSPFGGGMGGGEEVNLADLFGAGGGGFSGFGGMGGSSFGGAGGPFGGGGSRRGGPPPGFRFG